jgi:hypothetical protein
VEYGVFCTKDQRFYDKEVAMYLEMTDIYLISSILMGLIIIGFGIFFTLIKKHMTKLIARYIISDYTEIGVHREKIKDLEKTNKALSTRIDHLSESHVALTTFVEKFVYQMEISQQNQQEKRLDKFLH